MNSYKIYIALDSLETVNALCHVCDRYAGEMDIDVTHGRTVVDGKSILGVTSLIGKIVRLDPIIKEEDTIIKFFSEVEVIGAYKVPCIKEKYDE